MLKDEDLIAAGYHKHKGGSCRLNHSDCLFQKRVEADDVTRYFINVWQYYPKPEFNNHCGSTAEAVMYFQDMAEPWVTLTYHGAKTPREVEEFFEEAWLKLDMGPDAHNQR